MTIARRITLELLRPGSSRTQLVSPHTSYLAVRAGADPVALQLPFDHHLYFLRHELIFRGGQGASEQRIQQAADQLSTFGKKLGKALSQLDGLLCESAGPGGQGLVHLDLVYSAAELSLLRFESVSGAFGASPGVPRIQDVNRPMTLTRRRRFLNPPTRDPQTPPRVLVIVSDIDGPVAGDAHLAAIEELVRTHGGEGSLFTALRRASLERIQEASRAQRYTHIHIVAPARARSYLGGARFALALHPHSGNEPHLVLGCELASSLKCSTEGYRSPTVVTIAAHANAYAQPAVPPGGGFAHELHEQGIPVVVASHSPLSDAGALMLAKAWYLRSLTDKAEDPATTAHFVRQDLRTHGGPLDGSNLLVFDGLVDDFARIPATTAS